MKNKNNSSNKINNKFVIITVVLCVLILAAAGTIIYFMVQNAKAEQLAKETAEQMALYEEKLEAAIEESAVLCPEILKYTGENEASFTYFVENINSSDDIYEKAVNANSLLRTTAFYLDQFMAVGLEDIENGNNVSVYYTAETNDYKSQLTALRNEFSKNWYGFLGKSDLNITDDEEETEIETES